MILLLGGTGVARRLAETLAPHVPLIASLSGATKSPKIYPCETRVGGFGGAAAMAEWVTAHNITAIIDATHPFASQISANALCAARTTNTPIIAPERAPWTATERDNWNHVTSLRSAVAALPPGARAFFATGRGGLEVITKRTDIWAALRVVDDPKAKFPGHGEFIIARPPFDRDAEMALFALLGITHIVAKNAGGDAARAKLDAAAALGLPVLLIERPSGATAPCLPFAKIPAWAKAQANKQSAAKRTPDDASGA